MTPAQMARSIGSAIGLAAFVIGLPSALVAIGALPWPHDSGNLRSALLGPDDGTAALVVIALVAWGAWVVGTAAIVADVITHVRGVTSSVPWLALPRRLTGPLVASAAMLFVAAPTVALPLTAPPAQEAAPADSPVTAVVLDPVNLQPDLVDETSGVTTVDYTVRRGDSLWRIAERLLGDGRLYRGIFALNRDVIGDDPDFILPGTVLKIPVPADPVPPALEGQPNRSGQTARELAELPLSVEKTSEPGAQPRADLAEDQRTEDHSPSTASSEPWLIPGLVGGGGALGGVLFLAYRANRRTQDRRRRPGHRIAPLPARLRNVEKTLASICAPRAERLVQLHRLLATLADAPPRLRSVRLDDTNVTLDLLESADLPRPWRGEGTTWTAELTTNAPAVDVDGVYPLLVSIGTNEQGELWFIDLDQWHRIAITGEHGHALDLARHLCAELTLNPWSTLTRVDAFGLGNELADLDPMRLKVHPDAESVDDFADSDVMVVDASQSSVDLPPAPWPAPGRACVVVSSEEHDDHLSLLVGSSGTLRCVDLAIDLTAAGLNPSDAAISAAIAEVSRDAGVLWVPAVDPMLDAALTEPRDDEPAGPRSLLPASAERYEDCAATTQDDVETVAPLASPGARSKAEESDPSLDDDVAAWFDATEARPKLTLLGAVSATASGSYTRIAERKAYFVELLAYLALHPEGVPAAAIAEAFSISTSRARTDIGFVRSWLGNNPTDGRPHLPAANESQGYRETGVPGYQLENVLVDVDLFRRLRRRGQARGEDGIIDLVTALALVRGEPFSGLRERGWSWLLDGERLHETMTIAIVDTAHILVTDGLERGDLEQARSAAEVARLAAPFDEVGRLDLIEVARASGHEDLAEAMLRDDVINRRDDALPPIDLPERTQKILARQAANRPPD